MRTPETLSAWQRVWVLGLALLSLVVPGAGIVRGPGNEHQQLALLALGLACAIGALLGSLQQTPSRTRWLNVALASVGALISAYLLVALIGVCGAQVLCGVCSP